MWLYHTETHCKKFHYRLLPCGQDHSSSRTCIQYDGATDGCWTRGHKIHWWHCKTLQHSEHTASKTLDMHHTWRASLITCITHYMHHSFQNMTRSATLCNTQQRIAPVPLQNYTPTWTYTNVYDMVCRDMQCQRVRHAMPWRPRSSRARHQAHDMRGTKHTTCDMPTEKEGVEMQ